VDALGGIQVPAAQSATIAALKDRDAGVRVMAARGLGLQRDKPAPGTIPALLTAFNDRDGRVGAEAARSLAAIGAPAVPALVGALNAPGGTPQGYFAQQALRDIGRGAVPALVKATRTGDETTARFAALILGDLGTPEGIAALRAAAQRPSPEVRWAAERSLRALEADQPAPEASAS
jgi:HEAT repeat protein